LLGQPSVACSDSKHFFYAQNFTDTALDGFVPNAIALSRSSDGGQTWSDPVPVTRLLQNLGGEVFDDGRVAVDPSNPNLVYVAYRHLFTGFVFTPTGNCPPFPGPESVIEIVSSTDGGATFGPPITLDDRCGFFDNDRLLIGVRMAVSSRGRVHVAS